MEHNCSNCNVKIVSHSALCGSCAVKQDGGAGGQAIVGDIRRKETSNLPPLENKILIRDLEKIDYNKLYEDCEFWDGSKWTCYLPSAGQSMPPEREEKCPHGASNKECPVINCANYSSPTPPVGDKGWEEEWRKKYDIGSWVAPNGTRYPYSELYSFIRSVVIPAVRKEERERATNILNQLIVPRLDRKLEVAYINNVINVAIQQVNEDGISLSDSTNKEK